MKNIFYLILIFTFTFANNDNVGTSVANFLKIPVGGRAVSMSGAITAQVDDVSALYWNPAGISHIRAQQFMLHNTDWIMDLSHTFFGLVLPIGRKSNFGISLNILNVGSMEETTESEPHGTGRKFSANDIAIGLTYSHWVSDRFTFGVQAKLLQESISFSKAMGLGFDFGSQYITNFSGMKIGMVISNFGTKMRLYGTDQLIDVDAYPENEGNSDVNGRLETKAWSIPMGFRFGLSLTPIGKEDNLIYNENIKATINLDYFDSRDLLPVYSLGSEVLIANILYVRSGIEQRYEKYDSSLDDSATIDNLLAEFGYTFTPSWGIGLSSKSFSYLPYKIQFDYSSKNIAFFGQSSWYTFTIEL